jgi:hypothetical protein
MPRYYFQLDARSDRADDNKGIECNDLDEAIHYAEEIASELRQHNPPEKIFGRYIVVSQGHARVRVGQGAPGLRLNEHIEADGPTVFAHACIMGLEGIVSKRKDSRYMSGRSQDWLKSTNSESAAVRREAEEDWCR